MGVIWAGLLVGCLLTVERLAGERPIEWVTVPAGTFIMGCTSGQQGQCDSDEEPAHEVQITRSFSLSQTEITQGQWEAVTGEGPSFFSDCPACPVEQVSWFDAVEFAIQLSSDEGLESCYDIDGEDVTWPKGPACAGYRLPTEAEWEYAARAGQDTLYAGSDDLDEVGWYNGNSDFKTHPVGSKEPNAWGLYDMSGNVWEWTWDWLDAYPSTAQEDPTGPGDGQFRVLRGGGWGNTAPGARLVYRVRFTPGLRGSSLGLRLARSSP